MGWWERKQIPASLLEWGQQPSKAICWGYGGWERTPLLLEVQLEPHAGLCCCGRHLDSLQGLPCRCLGRDRGPAESCELLLPPLRCQLSCSGAALWTGGGSPLHKGTAELSLPHTADTTCVCTGVCLCQL